MKDLEIALSVTRHILDKSEYRDIFVTQDNQIYINSDADAIKKQHPKVVHVKINGVIQTEIKKIK